MNNLLWGICEQLDDAETALSACAEFYKEVDKARAEGPRLEPKPDPLRGFKLVHNVTKGGDS